MPSSNNISRNDINQKRRDERERCRRRPDQLAVGGIFAGDDWSPVPIKDEQLITLVSLLEKLTDALQ